MPDIENTDLGWLIQFLGRVNTLAGCRNNNYVGVAFRKK